jgi:site-specific DNA-cytosine methylase
MQRLVDIFSGCGGLSLGFDLHESAAQFRTCLAIDNEPSATRIFNDNFKEIGGFEGIARTADVCWFESATEIRLYYLAHIAKLEKNNTLKEKLLNLGFLNLLEQLKLIDERSDAELSVLSRTDAFIRAGASVSPSTYTLAAVKRVLSGVALKSFTRPSVDSRRLPWSDEYTDPFWSVGNRDRGENSLEAVGREYGKGLWESATAGLRARTESQGKGQHAGNGAKYKSLMDFLSSASGKRLRDVIVHWRGSRKQAIAQYVSSSSEEIERLYLGYRVAGLLGGPPCKGFSRIGRPVANSLREQGVFAWSDDEFGDERNKLMLHYVLFLEALRPDFFVFENVSNFQSSLKTPDGNLKADEIFAEAVENLSQGHLEYDVSAQQLIASDYSVPQLRQRYIMVGLNRSITNIRAAAFFNNSEHGREVTTLEAFFGLPSASEFTVTNSVDTGTSVACSRVEPPPSDPALSRFFSWIQQAIGTRVGETDGHIYRRMRADDAAFFRFVGPGIRWMDWELRTSTTLKSLKTLAAKDKNLSKIVEGNLALRLILEETVSRYSLGEQHLLHESYLKNRSGTHGDWLERLAGDRPAKTVVAHIGKDTYGYIHPAENRPLTVREAARLQSFPDAFSFAEAGVVDAYTAIGNAVPPLLANVFARRLSSLLYAPGEELQTVVPLKVTKARRERR